MFKFEEHDTPIARVRDLMTTYVDILISSDSLVKSFNTTFINFLEMVNNMLLDKYDHPEYERTREVRLK